MELLKAIKTGINNKYNTLLYSYTVTYLLKFNITTGFDIPINK